MIVFGDNNINQAPRPSGQNKPAPIDDSHFLDMLFGSACRKQCIKKQGGKGAGLKDCIRECKGKGITKSKAKEIELAQQANIQEILAKSLKDDDAPKSNVGVWIVVAIMVIALFGGIVFMMNRKKAATA
jgi:hypothetical protein